MAHGPLNNILTIACWREQTLTDVVVRLPGSALGLLIDLSSYC